MEHYCSRELICDAACVLSIGGSTGQIQEGRKTFRSFQGKQPKSSLHSPVRLRVKVLPAHTGGGLHCNRLCLSLPLFPGRSQHILLYSTKLPFPLNCQNRKMGCDFFFSSFLSLPSSLALFQPICLWFREMPRSCCQAIPPCLPLPLVTYTDGSLPETLGQSWRVNIPCLPLDVFHMAALISNPH